MSYFLYIVACADGTLYTGIAVDVARRLLQHNGEKPRDGAGKLISGKGARYTSSRRPVRLVYQTAYPSRSAALKAEIRVKRLSRQQKQRLIDGVDLEDPPAEGAETRASGPQVLAASIAGKERACREDL